MTYKNIDRVLTNSSAGKMTILTALVGLSVFLFVFLIDVGTKELQKADAALSDTATTSVRVLNTPPSFLVEAQESTESSTSTPTNSGDTITWTATADDSNDEDYYLLICDTSATPTASTGSAPSCGAGALQWAVSVLTTDETQATAATTTSENFPPFAERNNWFAWVCDSVATNPRCSNAYSQGSGNTASPFHVNRRPTFTGFWNDSPEVPGNNVTFFATSSDADTVGGGDTLQLLVCNDNDYIPATNECGAGGTLATSTFAVGDRTAVYTIVVPTQDQTYTAYGFIVDEHGHEASGGAQGTDAPLIVLNIAPSILANEIYFNNATTLVLTTEGGETTGFEVSFDVSDGNSCENATAGDEITGYVLSVYRSGIGQGGCTGAAGDYDINNCYPSGIATTTWNLSCTASSTTCGGPTDQTQRWDCTFPLWYVADPTDGGATETQFFAENWIASISPVDDNFATGTYTEAASGQELASLLALELNSDTIAFGELEPGSQTDPLEATTSVAVTGNTGLDENITGHAMCQGYETGSPCPVSSTSTIPAEEQVFATSSADYIDAFAMSSTSQTLLEINIPKSTTTVPSSGLTYWGIRIPASINFAGIYTGENTFTAVVSDPSVW